MSVVHKRIGGKIAEIRLAHKLTQAQLAERVDLSDETISRMERGVSFPSLKTIEKIACSLDVSIKDFFEFDIYFLRDKSFEKELAKLISFLRTLDKREIVLIHKTLKDVSKVLKEKPTSKR